MYNRTICLAVSHFMNELGAFSWTSYEKIFFNYAKLSRQSATIDLAGHPTQVKSLHGKECSRIIKLLQHTVS